jgi:hypothetical protein
LTYGIKIDQGTYARSNPSAVQTSLHTLTESINIRKTPE